MSGATLEDVVRAAIARLREAGIDNPALDARLLAGHALGLDRVDQLSQWARILGRAEQAAVDVLIDRRAARAPVARILGRREFHGLSFGLNEATLEPRPDSETLVDAALDLRPDARTILDLGTGSGCLLLSLLHELPRATGLGIDIARRAVEQAIANAAALGLAARASFRTGDWLTGVIGPFDLIVSNPPYIPRGALANLMPEVRDHDPHAALDGGVDGCDPCRLLIPALPSVLAAGGVVVMEVGHDQADTVTGLFTGYGFAAIATHSDLGGHRRCVSARWSG